jgi:transcriptional regulator with XRE-family HTH domain
VPRRYEPQPALGRAVRERREALALTQLDVAARADIAPMHLSKIENGSGNPSLGTIRRIAAALDLLASELVRRAEQLDEH